MNYKAVLFDFDYTLGDATDAILAGFTYGMGELGYPAPDRETVRHTVGMLLEDAYTALSGDATIEGRAHFRALFSKVARPMQAEGVPLFPGAEELLRALHSTGIITAVVSTKHAPTLEKIISFHGLSSILSLIVGGDMVSAPKPDPEGLHFTMEKLGLTPQQVLFCGDTIIDAETAQRAGVDFAAVLNGTTGKEAFGAYPNVHIAPDLLDLRSWLGV